MCGNRQESGIGGGKMNQEQRLLITRGNVERVGYLDETNQIVTLEFLVDNLGLDVAEDMRAIEKGEKKQEETNICLKLKVLNSLSNAVNALSNSKKAD